MRARSAVWIFAAAAGFCSAASAGVVRDGLEWRQLTETTNFTWLEVAASCPQDGTPCTAPIVRAVDGTSVDVTGWTWARNSDVRALWESIIPGADFGVDTGIYTNVDDAYIHEALSGAPAWFTPTTVSGDARYLDGWSASTSGSNGLKPQARDLAPGSADRVALGLNLGTSNRLSNGGVWLYRPAAAGLSSLKLSASTVAGCKSVTATVTLTKAAPAGGVVVTLADTLSAATTPATATIAEGLLSKRVAFKTTQVLASESGQVSATLGDKTLTQDLTVRPLGLTSVSLSPTLAVGGKPVVGTAKLECVTTTPVMVDFASSNAAVATPVAASLPVAAGLQSVKFDVVTNPVLIASYATISGTANGIKKTKKLTVNPAASVSPTSLKFGSVAVGTTSPTRAVLLYNKGASPFTVTGISLTGTYASWFAQTHDCPSSLDPGASCTIGVTFTPAAAASKSAKLSIATSATSTPLSVSLSGTGIVP
jgi:hypothetical protein